MSNEMPDELWIHAGHGLCDDEIFYRETKDYPKYLPADLVEAKNKEALDAARDWLVRLYKYAQTTHDSAEMRDQIDFWYLEIRKALGGEEEQK